MRVRAAIIVVLSLVAVGCGAKGDGDSPQGGDGTTTTAAVAATTSKFGTLDSPCGKDVDGKKITLDPAEAGKGADKIYIGVANDRTAEARPGLLKEMWDSTVAFANWCTKQGGIGGLPVEAVDLDGKLFKIESAMTTACSSVFAMVGGGYAQDNQVFTGKDGSDFHRCKMIAVTGFAVSTDFADANGVIQPIPQRGYRRGTSSLQVLERLFPDEVKKTTVVYGEGLESIRVTKDQNKATMEQVDGFGLLDDVSYKILNQDNSVTAQKVIDLGATHEFYVGEPENFASMLAELKTKGWKGISFADANQYDPKLFSKGPEAANGALIRTGVHPFEEADKWPATRQLLDIIKTDGPPDAKIASLSVQSFSAGLLFATAVTNCAKASGGQVSRACVIDAAKQITSWDGGGLHVKVDQSGKSRMDCSMILEVKDGTFVRKFPKLGSKDDSRDGFYCDPDGIVDIEGDFGQGNVDPTLPY